MPRIEFSRKVRRQIIERAQGKCEKCGAALKPGEGDADHILPAELGGQATLANGMWLCKPCHKAKTADDVRRIRKADRQRDKHTGAWKPSARKLGRPAGMKFDWSQGRYVKEAGDGDDR